MWHRMFAIRFGFSAATFMTVLAAATGPCMAQNTQSASPLSTFQPTGATASLTPNDPPSEWHSQARDYANTRYSPLTDITPQNVGQLRVAWTFSDGTQYGHEGAPLVIGDTMYLVTPFPNIAYALDLSKPGSPVKWAYDPDPSPMAIGKACCDAVLRGWAYANGKIIYNVLDGHTIALDAKTGRLAWRIKMSSVATGATMTMSVLAVGNKVFAGNSGGEMGVHGWIAALDVDTGKEVWRAYSTGPDDQVKIGADFKPFYSWMKGKDLGVSSWPEDAWKQGGGAVWGWVSYDPDLKLIYYGTSNPSPRVPSQRPGLNLWTSTVFARDADTGMARWAFQLTPHDQWDFDASNENVLIDVPIGGKAHKALVQLSRNGFAYTIDRETGEVLVAKPFGDNINWATGIDAKTAQPIVNPDKEPKTSAEVKDICPSNLGVKDWEPAAFSPRTGLLYAGIFNLCMDLANHPTSYIAGTRYDGMQVKQYVGPGGNWGEFMAWDPVHGKKIWSIKEKFMTMSGALATASDLVFYGTTDGWFRAVDARTGAVLWQQRLGSGVIAQPITYKGPDGRQYVAVESGVGGVAVQNSAEPGFPARGNTLYVFSINGDSLASGPGLKTTEATAPAIIPELAHPQH